MKISASRGYIFCVPLLPNGSHYNSRITAFNSMRRLTADDLPHLHTRPR